MKKLILFALLLVGTLTANAQNVDNFYVGPYEVDYKGEGDYKFRLRKGIDLYQYFGLKKDTIIQRGTTGIAPVNNAIEVNVFMSVPRFSENGESNIFGVKGSWKKQIGNQKYFNAGLSFGLGYGKYNMDFDNLKDVFMEIGVPISIEFAKLNKQKATLFGAFGLVPTLYSTLKAEATDEMGKTEDIEKESGFLISPRIDFGAYIPCNEQLIKVGLSGEYKINCSGGDIDIYKDRIGRFFIGANIGLVF